MLRIFYTRACPYCQSVLYELAQLNFREGKDFELVEASYGSHGRKELIALGGINQVPFLADGSTKMYESEAIISYLRKKHG